MSLRKTLCASFAIAALTASPALAQYGPQLGTMPPTGQPVAPYFEGWYENPDGTYTFSFGYHNFNTEESVDIPIGTDNFIEPAEFDLGLQPTHFPVRPRRDRGVFTVTVPSEFADERRVVWTLRRNGQTLSVPARVGSPEYQLDHLPKPAGTLPPKVRFSVTGQDLVGLQGVIGDPQAEGANLPGTPWNPVQMNARVGEPLALQVWVTDNMAMGTRDTTEIHVNWHKHQGPVGAVEIDDGESDEEETDAADDQDENRAATGAALDGSVTHTATFTRPGEYVLRVAVDSFGADDSSGGSQCCWTNGYVRVNVTE